MTFSNERRIADVNEAIRILMAELDRRGLSDYLFMSTDPALAGVLRTTWDELENRRYIRKTSPSTYVLTGAGWAAGLRLTGQLDEVFRQKVFKLVGLLKQKVTGRRDDALVCVHDFDADGFPSGFLFNVVESGILEVVDPEREYGLRWSEGDPWESGAPFFVIRRTFGHRRLQ